MKHRYYLCALLVAAASFFGCYDDKGNYDYSETSEIVIDTVGFKTSYIVEMYDTLRIDPVVRYSSPESLSYRWHFYESGKATSWEIFSTNRKLNDYVSLAPGFYNAVLYATDTLRNITSSMTFRVEVSTQVHHGLLVVHGINGETDFDYIATPNSVPNLEATKRMQNILELQGRKLPGNPRTIREMGRNYGSYNAMYVSSDRDLFQINNKNFQILRDADELFVNKPQEVDVVGLGANGDTRLFFMGNGDMYEIATDRPTWDQSIAAPITASSLVEGEVRLWKEYLIPNGYSYLYNIAFFDTAGKRFLGRSSYPAYLVPFPEQSSSNIFDINNINKEILYLGRGFNYLAYAVFKDSDAPDYWLYSMDFNVRSDATNVPKEIRKMSALPEIVQAKFFNIGTLGEVFIYASSRNIYTYDYAGANTATKINADFPANEEITALRIYNPTLLSAVNERILYVGTWDGTQGKLYEFGFNPASGQLTSQTPLNVFEGFGRITDMNIKTHYNTW